MRALAITLLVALAVAPQAADASQALSKSTAQRYAQRAAANRAKSKPGMVGWELVRGFRFESRKWVFVWYAQMADGQICSAQLVTRYASTKSNKVVAYFRMEQCS